MALEVNRTLLIDLFTSKIIKGCWNPVGGTDFKYIPEGCVNKVWMEDVTPAIIRFWDNSGHDEENSGLSYWSPILILLRPRIIKREIRDN
jgi:hypothetical protein